MKLSRHSKQRMMERANVSRNQEKFFKNALQYGLSIEQIKDEKLKKELKNREKWNSRIKVYKGYVFVYSRNSHQLYTLYKLEGYDGII